VSDYATLLKKLRADIKNLNLKRHKLKEHQKSMLDFIEGRKSSSQYVLNGQIFQLTRGNEEFGFEHILKQHYQDDSNGKLTPREILNIWMLLERGSKVSDFEQSHKGNIAYKLFKEHNKIQIRLMLINFKDKMIYRILTYYSDRENEETGDLS